MLASHFSWIHETLERLGKDGKEAVWRTVGEGVVPEAIDLSEGLGYRYVQRCLHSLHYKHAEALAMISDGHLYYAP